MKSVFVTEQQRMYSWEKTFFLKSHLLCMSVNAARECIEGSIVVRHLDKVNLANILF